jgi:hypothetical protein
VNQRGMGLRCGGATPALTINREETSNNGYQDPSGHDIGGNDLVPTRIVRTTSGGMPSGIYFASATKLLRYGTNLPSGIHLAPPAPPVRYSANLPFGVYLAPAPPPLRHTLIAVVGAKVIGRRAVDGFLRPEGRQAPRHTSAD